MNDRRRSKSSKKTNETAPDARFGIAMLKIAMELKKSKGASVDQVVGQVAAQMSLNESELRAHLASQGRLLRDALRKRNA